MKALLFAALLNLSLTAQATVQDIQDMKQIWPAIKPGTLVVFDIDNTILKPAQTLGSDQWYGSEVRRLTAAGMTEDLAIATVIPIWMSVQNRTAVLPVESFTPALIRFIQKQNIPAMALTARPTVLAQTTIDQLRRVGVDLRNAPATRTSSRFEPNAETLYSGGVLFVGPRQNKGDVLRAFLGETAYRPSRLVFTDDKPHHVANVEKALTGTGIDYVGFRYGAADSWVRRFDAQLAKRELEIFRKTGRLISDAEASGAAL